MIEVFAGGNAALMAGLLDRMAQGGAARARLYTGARGNTNTLVALVTFAEPAGTIDVNGDLVLSTGVESVAQTTGVPTWALVSDGNETALFDCDVRANNAPDLGQELVISASALAAGGRVQILGGKLSALP